MHDEESPSEELLLHLSRTREAPATPCQKVKLQVEVEVPGSRGQSGLIVRPLAELSSSHHRVIAAAPCPPSLS